MTPEILTTIVLIVAFVLLIAHNIPIAFSIGIATVFSYLCLWPDRPILVFTQISKDIGLGDNGGFHIQFGRSDKK